MHSNKRAAWWMAHSVRVPPLSQASAARSASSLALAGIACAMIGLSCTISIFVIVLLTSCAVLLRKLLGGAAERGRRIRSVSPDALCAEPRALVSGQLHRGRRPSTSSLETVARRSRRRAAGRQNLAAASVSVDGRFSRQRSRHSRASHRGSARAKR